MLMVISAIFVSTCIEQRRVFSDQPNLKEKIVKTLQESCLSQLRRLAVTSEAELYNEMKYSVNCLQKILGITKDKGGQLKKSEEIAAVSR